MSTSDEVHRPARRRRQPPCRLRHPLTCNQSDSFPTTAFWSDFLSGCRLVSFHCLATGAHVVVGLVVVSLAFRFVSPAFTGGPQRLMDCIYRILLSGT